ncbi:MAG: class I SAM-dependent methyltransferase [Campylobacterota bacterium]|nr:class I SAM-dependent methyltransferase [Campylobacterota bacterium]
MPRTDNTHFYSCAIKKHGVSPKALHWNSFYSQHVRFYAIASLLPQNLLDFSIVDAGCGFGDFYIFLKNEKLIPKKYIGLEILPNMAKIASKNCNQKIIICDILNDNLPKSDFYVCSGAMNILTPDETLKFITKCYEASKKGFIFNLLEGVDDGGIYNTFNIEEIVKTLKQICENITVKNDYLDDDFTIRMLK